MSTVTLQNKIRQFKRPLSTIAHRSLTTIIEERTLHLEILQEINTLLFSAKDINTFFNKFADMLKGKLGYQYIYIWLKSDEEKNIRVLANTNVKKNKEMQKRELSIGIVGDVMRTKQMIIAQDVAKSPNYFQIDPRTKAQLAVPLLNDRYQCIGAMSIESRQKDFFTPRDIHIVTSIAPTISHAIEEARLYQKVLYSERRHKNFINTMNESLWVGDKNGRTVYVNRNFEILFGYDAATLAGKPFYELFGKRTNDFIQQLKKKYKEIQAGKRRKYELEVSTQKGEKLPVLLSCAPTQTDGVLAFITDLRNLKEAEKAIASLQTKERYLANITQNSMDAIVSLNADDIVQTWNVGAENMFGYKAEEIVGKSIRPMIPLAGQEKKEAEYLLKEANEKGYVHDFETIRLRKNGEPIMISLTYTAIKDDTGAIIGYSAIYRDITAQKQAEKELQARFDRMQEAYIEMGRQRRYIDYLADLMELTGSSIASLQHIGAFIVNAVTIFAKVDAATLRVYRSGQAKLELIALNGVSEDWWGKKMVSITGTIWERAMKLKRSITVLDITKEPAYASLALARKNNLRSAQVIPLFVHNDFIGTLSLYLSDDHWHNSKNIFGDEFIDIFAAQAALVLKITM